MYNEGFEDLEETDDTPRRAYVSNVSQDDSERILRENERLKKALEKEQFFNKLLDQEIQELKGGKGASDVHQSEYWYGSRGISKGAFYSLLLITLAMGAYIGYGIYSDKNIDDLKQLTPVTTAAPTEEAGKNLVTPPASLPENKSAATEQTPPAGDQKQSDENNNDKSPVSKQTDVPAVVQNTPAKDSVPNIISKKPAPPAVKEKTVIAPATTAKTEVDIESAAPDANTAAPVDTRPVIARYQVTSKANFYSNPDENSMRSTFISQGSDKVVGALEDKNGFIFVVYTNDLGYTSRGWLSKKDLTKVE